MKTAVENSKGSSQRETRKKEQGRGPLDGKKVFRKKGTCSRTFFYLLDREFQHLKDTEERAADSLAGGIMQKGYQCGMLWGSALAVGAEAYRRCDSKEQAMRVAVNATQKVMASFDERENTVNCLDVTQCDFSSKWSFAKYLISGRFLYCFNLAEQWAPDAVQAALEGLGSEEELIRKDQSAKVSIDHPCLNCASLVAEKLGASQEERVIVAGFAGGLGLSGGGCGALSAAIWMRSLKWCRENPETSSFKNPEARQMIMDFETFTGGEYLCSNLTGQTFRTYDDHSDFIRRKGCESLIRSLS